MIDLSGLKDSVKGRLLTREAEVLAYSYDAALDRGRPDGVVLARSAEDVRRTVKWCVDNGVPYVARGAGTNLSGGCVALRGGVVIAMAGMDRILAIDTHQRFAIVEPGVVNFHLQRNLEKIGWFYAPDPASFKICTLGGNAAENAGGPRCVKYGVTTNHIRAIEAVMPDGTLERFSLSDPGPEIMSLLIGAEGTLGVITKIWADILPLPDKIATALVAFKTLDEAMECVSGVIAAGIVPRVLEAMDRTTVESIEAFHPVGYPSAEAVLLIEVEGAAEKVSSQLVQVEDLCRRHGATLFRVATEGGEREKLWEGRRSAYAALARLAPNVMVEDGVVPPSRLLDAVRSIREITARNKVSAALLFHAGDGNLHPNMTFDERDKDLTLRTRRAGAEVLRACVELGGSISGEHGIGIDKREAMGWLFPPETLDLFRRIKAVLDPDELSNPDKLFPKEDHSEQRRCVPARMGMTQPAQSFIDRFREKAAAKEEIIVIGSGTKAPRTLRTEGREVLTVRPLARILNMDRSDFIITAEAGMLISELRAAVEKEGLYVHLPLTRGTLGGLLATKAWVGARDQILAMRILLADGRVAEVGAKVVKSVAGYDIGRLLLGSWGMYAVILDVTLRMHPRPGNIASDLPAPVRPGLGRWERTLAKAFDPQQRLNRWVWDAR